MVEICIFSNTRIFSKTRICQRNFLCTGVECATQAEIDQHLNLGMQMLTRGQYSDALSHFHAAVGE